jgi:hypothetical protein
MRKYLVFKFSTNVLHREIADMSDDDLSITAANRHQYFKTVMSSADASERKILEAEARGRARVEREEEASRKRGVMLRITLAVVVVVCVVAGVLFLRQLH